MKNQATFRKPAMDQQGGRGDKTGLPQRSAPRNDKRKGMDSRLLSAGMTPPHLHPLSNPMERAPVPARGEGRKVGGSERVALRNRQARRLSYYLGGDVTPPLHLQIFLFSDGPSMVHSVEKFG